MNSQTRAFRAAGSLIPHPTDALETLEHAPVADRMMILFPLGLSTAETPLTTSLSVIKLVIQGIDFQRLKEDSGWKVYSKLLRLGLIELVHTLNDPFHAL